MKDPFDAEGMEGLRYYAKYIAMVIRNAMEDFHCRHLSDEQMAELNPIIRDAVLYGHLCLPEREALQGRRAIRELPPDVDSEVLGRARAVGWVSR